MGEGLAYLAESDNRITHSASPIHVDIDPNRRLQIAEKPPSTFNSTRCKTSCVVLPWPR
jgi:hypothetical protein